MKTILIDWSAIDDPEDFYSSVLPQTDAPSWHGHNLDAIQDSWVTGDICSGGPPFSFIFRRSKEIKTDLKHFSETVVEIADESIRRHGGEIAHED